MSLTPEEEATNYHTMRHIERVRNLLDQCVEELLKRGREHDQCKLESPEVELFTEVTPQLSALTYGSPEYNAMLEKLKPALTHHYSRSRHHPEHFKAGINDMTLIDILEMLCDWKAASERHNDGNIRKSIEINSDRFEIGPQLTKILENTAKELFG